MVSVVLTGQLLIEPVYDHAFPLPPGAVFLGDDRNVRVGTHPLDFLSGIEKA